MLTNMQQATSWLDEAFVNQQHILVYGDYDVDGLCSLLLMRQFFSMINFTRYDIVKYTSRTHHVSSDVINAAVNHNTSLIIIIDTGSGETDLSELQKLTNLARVIVCDHHTPQFDYSLVQGCIFINPGFLDNIPYFSGACVAYELCIAYFKMFKNTDVIVAQKYLSFLACASLYSDSIYDDNFYTKSILKLAKSGIIPANVNFLPYIHASKRFFLYSFAPPFNACFRNNRLDLINNLFLGNTVLSYVDKMTYINEINKLRDYSREIVAIMSELCPVDVRENLIFSDLTGLLNQQIPNQYIRNNKGLIANILAAKYKTCAVVVVSDGSKFLLSVRDYYNRDILKYFKPFFNVGGHSSAFGGLLSNKERLELYDKLRFFNLKFVERHERNIIPFSYSMIETVAFENEYKQPKDVVFMRVPYDEVIEEWTPDSFSERYIQFKLKNMPVWWRKEVWYKQGTDMLVQFYVTTKLKAESVQEEL